jgi:thimet oligopeptidase
MPEAGPRRVTLPILDATTLSAACRQMLADGRAGFEALAALPLGDATPASVLDEWDRIAIALENIEGPIAILNNVHPDKSVRDAADDAIRSLSTFQVEIFQNEALFARVNAVTPESPAQAQFKKDLVEAFEDTGVSLPPDRRARAKAIAERMTVLSQEFARNLRENQERLAFSPDEMRGLPDSYLGRQPRDDKGNYLLSYDYPDFNPFMANAESAAARRRYYIGYLNRGTARNLEILDEVVGLRREIASLYGLPSFAHFVLRRRMAAAPQAVERFLAEVKAAVEQAERNDLEELRALKAAREGTSVENTVVSRWDVPYLSERLREARYNVDQESLRKYFPPQAALAWLLDISSTLYGLRFERASVPLWHEDVFYYDVVDAENGAFIGGIYFDLYPREGKFPHAAAWPVRGVARRAGRTPISVLVANFDRRGLTHDEVETLFHEFGHILHGVLSEATYNFHAGTSVQRDFVETPSQIFEEWARRLQSLQRMRSVSPDTPVMDPDLVERLNAARRFGKGLLYARQWLYASFDLALTGEAPGAALPVWKKMEGDSLLGHVPDTAFPGTFGHIVGGYAAGYYGYMWAEVIALDMLSVFGDDIMNPEIGRRFRREVLSRGGESPAATLVERFLGRPVNSDAFFKEIVGQRH